MRLYRPLARIRVLVKLAFILQREAHYQLASHKYRYRQTAQGKVNLATIFSVGAINLFILLATVLIVLAPIPPKSKLFSLQVITLIFVVLTVFSGSWNLQMFGLLDNLLLMSLDTPGIRLVYMISSLISSVWMLGVMVLAALYFLFTAAPLLALLTPLTLVIAFLLGSSLGFLMSSLIGGRRYSGVSWRSSVMQFVNGAVYVAVIYAIYQIQYLAVALASMASEVAYRVMGLPILFPIYPFAILYIDRPVVAPILAGWLLISLALYVKSFRYFMRSIVSPVYVALGKPKRKIAPRRMGMYTAMLLKDLKSMFRDVRLIAYLALPVVAIVSILSRPLPPGIETLTLVFVANIMFPPVLTGILRIDDRASWILFANGLTKRALLKSKALTDILILSMFYVPMGIHAALTDPSGTAMIAASGITSLMTTLLPQSIIVRNMSYEGYGAEPDVKLSFIALLLSAISTGVLTVAYLTAGESPLISLTPAALFLSAVALAVLYMYKRM